MRKLGWGLLVVVVGVSLLAGAARATEANQVCPEGYDQTAPNTTITDRVGCTVCFEQSGCELGCLVPPPSMCPEGPEYKNCCRSNPCADNCAEPKPLKCFTATCECEPEDCCFEVCPTAPAPAASPIALIALALALVGIGGFVLFRKARYS